MLRRIIFICAGAIVALAVSAAYAAEDQFFDSNGIKIHIKM